MKKIHYMIFINCTATPEVEKADILQMLVDKKIFLTPTEFKLFSFLYTNKNQICSYNLILDKVWSHHTAITSNTLSQYINYLRKKFKHTAYENCIITHPKFGYKFTQTSL